MRQQGRVILLHIVRNNLISVLNASHVIDHDYGFHHKIVKVVCGSTRQSPGGSIATLTIDAKRKFM